MRRATVLVIASVAFSATPLAFGATVTPNAETMPNAIYAVGGLGAPLGLVGLEYERTVARFFEVSAGGGLGLGGPQAALMPRLLIPLGRRRISLALGAGISYGRYQTWVGQTLAGPGLPDPTVTTWAGTVLWGNAEVAFEYRGDSGLYWRAFGGPAHVLRGKLTCADSSLCDPADEARERTIPYGGAAFGWAF